MKKYKLKVVPDADAESPRSWDNLGTIAAVHRRYDFADAGSIDPHEFNDDPGKDQNYIYLPVYMYEHSGIALKTTPFSCPWDSGQIGFIYVSKDKVRQEYKVKRVSKKLIDEKIYPVLRAEIEVYSKYLGGEVYGYVIAELTNEDALGSKSAVLKAEEEDSCYYYQGVDYDDFIKGYENIIESCYGFYTVEDAKKAAIDKAEYLSCCEKEA